jgi:hypothetical protein
MRVRSLMSAVLLAAVMSGAVAVQASAQALRPSDFSPSPERRDFTLTSQPLFGTSEAQATTARTQRDPELGFGFGVKGGPLFLTFKPKDATTNPFESRNGWMAGVFFGGNRPGIVGVQPEVLYGKKGAPTVSGTQQTDLYFIEIPVLLRINIGTQSINKWVVYGIVGPAFDIKLKGKQGDLDVGDNYAGLDFGIVAGAGFEIFRFLVEGRGNWGVRNVVGGSLADLIDVRDRSFALLFGFRIN